MVKTGSSEIDGAWSTMWGYVGVHGRKRLTGVLFVRGTIGFTAPLSWRLQSCDRRDRVACTEQDFTGNVSVFGGAGLEVELF